MFRPLATAQFKRDRKLMKKRGKEVAKLNHVMTMLALKTRCRPASTHTGLPASIKGTGSATSNPTGS